MLSSLTSQMPPRASGGLAWETFRTVTGVLDGVGRGAGLAGLVLLVARRWRGRQFPKHPGEYVLCLLAFGAVCVTANNLLRWLVGVWGVSVLWMPLSILQVLAAVVLVLWAAVRVKSRRWRAFLVLSILAPLLEFLFLFLLFRVWGGGFGIIDWAVRLPPHMIAAGVLLRALLYDHFEGKRFPWTHWFGVTLYFWSVGTYILRFLCVLLLQTL